MEVVRTREGGLSLSQSLYIQNVLGRFMSHMPGPSTKLNGAETPMDHRIRLHKNGATHMRFKPNENDIERGAERCEADVPYREVVGTLLWLANGTRPDILFAVNQVAKYCCDPRVAHWNACKRILRYLSETADFGIHYSSVSPDTMSTDMKNMPLPTAFFTSNRSKDVNVNIESYVDADFANSVNDRHSISGYAFMLVVGPLAGSQGLNLR